MNRKIKFMAWDKVKKRMLNVGSMQWKSDLLAIGVKSYWPRKFELLQFTGFEDKNGEEIYEGDIIKTSSDTIWAVEWQKEMELYNGVGCGYDFSKFRDWSEVVGNIYENPELLQKHD